MKIFTKMVAILFLRVIITNNNLKEGAIVMKQMNVERVNYIYDYDLNSAMEFGFFWLPKTTVSSYTSFPIQVTT